MNKDALSFKELRGINHALEAENAKLKAELVKERECVDFYAAKTNWGKTNQRSINRMCLSDTTQDGSFQFRGVWIRDAEIAGKRARQRQKERDQSILKDSNEE